MRLSVEKLKSKVVYVLIFGMLLSVLSGLTPKTHAEDLHKYSGEEIFSGVVFGQGDVSKLFPEIWNSKDYKVRNTDKSKEAAKQVIKEMKKMDAKYFEDLKEYVYSKDLNKIDEQFDKGGDLLKKAADKVNLGSSEHADVASGKCVETLGAAIFVLVVAAGGAIDYLYVYNSTKFWGVAAGDDESKLATEMFVKSVADKLN
ncbi:sporulation delaying protein family toxin [Bacillus atrophaeus]|uniref:sporulation delaying protein family toxin n=1 Tax=Bacillus atrophaeus TaxID=1452 RepID=UPI00352933B7